MSTFKLPSRKSTASLPAALQKHTEPPIPKPVRRIPKTPLDVLVCTPDINSATTQRFLKSLQETTEKIRYDLYVVCNRGRDDWKHSIALNKALDIAEKTGHNLLICDDDIQFDDPKWLDKALDLAESQPDDLGIIGFNLSYPNEGEDVWATAFWSGDNGLVRLCKEQFKKPCCIPMQCSACWLIAPTSRRFDTRYNKYRFELVFALETWEDGKKFWSIPAKIKHDCGTQYKLVHDDLAERIKLCKVDEELYRSEWIDTGREFDILEKITPYMPEAILKDEQFRHEKPHNNIKVDMSIKNERRAVVTVAVGEYFKKALPLIQRYARKCNADYFCIDEAWMGNESSAHYLKWKCNAIMAMGYNRILFVDSDVMIMPNSPDIFDLVPVGTLGVFDEAPIMQVRGLNRKDTCERFISSWRRQIGDIEYKYPGHYFNSGVMVFDTTCNPFVVRNDGVYSFNTDSVFDQTYLNIVSATYPKTLLDWQWNRMAINQAHTFIGSDDMFYGGAYFLHYCGNAEQKKRIDVDMLKVYPQAYERLPGASRDGICDWWQYVKAHGVKTAVEVGSAHGESAWEATSIIPELQLICVDPWEGERYGKTTRANFDIRHAWNKNITPFVGYSVEAAKTIPDGSLDAVYIDAMHEDPWITEDVNAWLPKVRNGGIIGGHDYIWKVWPDVVNAVNKKFGGPDLVFKDTSWLIYVGG